MNDFLKFLANGQMKFVNLVRVSIFIVMVWIGGLKAFQYEADGIVPFVANSPLMSFFYANPAPEYNAFKNKEGEVVPENIEWHQENRTYLFSYGLGIAIIIIGVLALAGIWNAKLGVIGGVLTFIMSIVTLSFLVTTPESFVPNLGGEHFGFPYLSAAGRLVIKDVIMLAAGLICAGESASRVLRMQPVNK